MKVSAFTGTTDGSDESLLMLSYSTDGGQTYQTRKIRLDDFIDDFNVEDLKNVDGTPAQGQVLAYDTTTGLWTPKNSASGLGLQNTFYKYNDDSLSATPANGYFHLNSTTLSGATIIYFDHETDEGVDVQNFFSTFIQPGQYLYLQEDDRNENYAVYEITTVGLLNSSSVAVGITFVQGTQLRDNQTHLVSFIPRQNDGTTTIPDDVMREGENISLLNNDAGYLTAATVTIPDDVMREGEDISLLNNDADYIAVGDAAASGYTLLALQNLQVEEGNLGRTILAVGYVGSDFQQADPTTPKAFEEVGAVQLVSLGDGNAVTVYSDGNDYMNGIISQGPFFLDDGETFVLEVCEPGNIITMSEGGYGYSEQRRSTFQSPMPLLSLGLAFRESFVYAFRNSSDPSGATAGQGRIHVVAGPVPTKVSLFDAASGFSVNGQENIEIGPFGRAVLYTDGNQEYRIKATEPIMACIHAQMGPGQEQFHDSRLVMPLTNDGITWSRSGNASALYQNTEVTYYLNGTSNPGTFTVSPNSPVGLQGVTGNNDTGYAPGGAVRLKAKGLISAYSGADGAGLEATPMCPVSVMSQKVPLVGLVVDDGSSAQNSITVASPYEGTFQIWAPAAPGLPVQLISFEDPDGGVASEIPLVRRGVPSPSSYVQQYHPASAQIKATADSATGCYGFVGNFEGGYLLSNVPCMVIMNNTQGTTTADTILYRGSSGNNVPGVQAKSDETLMLGISPEIFKLNVRMAQDRLFYRQELSAGGVESWTRC